jgi:hypothetical protein
MFMHPDMIYAYPTWKVGLLVVGLAAGGAVIVELVARQVLSLDARREGNDVAAAMFSVIGVTFAVLLAFVVMLTYESYASARATTVVEAGMAAEVQDATTGLATPVRAALRRALVAYLDAVILREWPAQAGGHEDDSGEEPLRAMIDIASVYQPAGTSDADDHQALLAALARLREARATRRLAAMSGVPGLVWVVMLLGGAMTVSAASFLAAPNARMHMAMSATLAASGGLVVVMVIALNQPFRGDLRISAQAFERLRTVVASSTSPGGSMPRG